MELEVDVQGIDLTPSLHGVVVRRIASAVDRFGDRVQRVSVRFSDLNGLRGGLDTRCRIEADVHAVGTVVVQDTQLTAFQAVASAAEKLTRATARRLERRRVRRARALRGTLA